MLRQLLSSRIIRFQSCLYSTSLNISNEVQIPKKIYRTELSVLKAMAKCVELESGASIYSLINEPWLYPTDFNSRKKYLLSKASGKLSARMAFNDIKNEFINATKDEPKVKCLMPLFSPSDVIKKVESGEFTIEKGLYLIINLIKPKEALQFYETHKSSNFSLPVMQNLLELLCSTIELDTDLEVQPEERYVSKAPSISWRLDNEAEIFFLQLPTKTKEAYNAIIRGAGYYQNPARALELFQEFKSKFPDNFLDLKACNSLLRSLHYAEVPGSEIEDCIIDIFNGMARHKINPNVLTFNNAIYALSNRQNIELVEQIYQEMLALNIEPILGTYSILLRCKFPTGYIINLAEEVLGNLEQRMETIDYEEIQSPDDLDLFRNMMEFFRNTNSLELGLRLHDVVINGGRIHLLHTDTKRGSYGDNFVKLLIACSRDIELILNKIKVLVPNYYIMQPSSVEAIIKALKTSASHHLISVLFDMTSWNNSKLASANCYRKLLDLISELTFDGDDLLKASLSKSFDKFFESSKFRRETVLMRPQNVQLTIEILMKMDDWELLWKYVKFGNSHRLLTPTLIQKLVRKCVTLEDLDKVLFLMESLADCLERHQVDNSDEQISLAEFLLFCQDKVRLVFEDNCINTTQLLRHLSQCQRFAGSTSSSDSSSSSSSDSDEAYSSDDEETSSDDETPKQ